MGHIYRRLNGGKSILLFIIALIAGISTVGFTYKFYTVNETEVRVNQLENNVRDLRVALNLEKIRRDKIQKIVNIIDGYNDSIEPELKHQIAGEIFNMSVKYSNLDIDLICATITHESALSWSPEVVSPAGAMGLMQIMPNTATELCMYEGIEWTSAEDLLFNPILNIRMGCRYLSYLINSYEVDGGLAAYNGGARRAEMWVKNNKDESILWEETRGYIPAVLKLYKKFQDDIGIL